MMDITSIILWIIIFIILGSALIFTIIGQWETYKKAKMHGWAAIVPVYGAWTLYKIGDVPPILALFHIGFYMSNTSAINAIISEGFKAVSIIDIFWLVCSLLAIIFHIRACLGIANHFEKSTLFGIGLVVLPFIFFPIIGMSKDVYK